MRLHSVMVVGFFSISLTLQAVVVVVVTTGGKVRAMAAVVLLLCQIQHEPARRGGFSLDREKSAQEPKNKFYNFAIPWLGEGLLVAAGERWVRSRRLLTPAFHFDILKPYVEVGNRAADLLLKKVKKYVDEKRSIEMFSNISLCALDMILRCAMSYKNDIQEKGESHPYVQAVTELTYLWMERFRNPWVHPDFVYWLTKNGRRFKEKCHYVHGVSERVIKDGKESLERGGPPKKRYLDFLDIMLTAKDSNGIGLTPLEIRNEVDTFMVEETALDILPWLKRRYTFSMDPKYPVEREMSIVMRTTSGMRMFATPRTPTV